MGAEGAVGKVLLRGAAGEAAEELAVAGGGRVLLKESLGGAKSAAGETVEGIIEGAGDFIGAKKSVAGRENVVPTIAPPAAGTSRIASRIALRGARQASPAWLDDAIDAAIANAWREVGRVSPGMRTLMDGANASLGLRSARQVSASAPAAEAKKELAAQFEQAAASVNPALRRMDAGEYVSGSMNALYRGEQSRGVRYLGDNERRTFEVTIRDGKFYDAQGLPISTRTAKSAHSGTGHAIFVLSPDGKLYMSMQHSVGRFHHSSFLAGGDVLAAGELTLDEGRLVGFTDRSGHYMPTQPMMRQFAYYLNARGIDLSAVPYNSMRSADRAMASTLLDSSTSTADSTIALDSSMRTESRTIPPDSSMRTSDRAIASGPIDWLSDPVDMDELMRIAIRNIR